MANWYRRPLGIRYYLIGNEDSPHRRPCPTEGRNPYLECYPLGRVQLPHEPLQAKERKLSFLLATAVLKNCSAFLLKP